MRTFRLFLAGLVAVTAACSSAPSPRTASARSDSRTITRAELQGAPQTNLYDFIQATRPRWLQGSGPTQISAGGPGGVGGTKLDIAVFLNNQNIGGPAQLRSFALNGVQMVRYYTASEAQTRFNVRDIGSLIQILTEPTP
jgi:hypothetical protein